MIQIVQKQFLQFKHRDPLLRRIVANSGWLLGANSLGTVFSLIQGVLVARVLGVEKYGILAVVMTFVTVVNRLTSFRMSEFVIKYVSDALEANRPDQAAAATKIALGLEAGASVIAFGVVWFLAPLGASWFVDTPDAESLIKIYGVVVLGNLVSETSTGLLQVFNQFRLQSILLSISRAVSLIAVLFVFLQAGGLRGILLAYLLGNIVTALLLLFSALRETTRHLGKGWCYTSFTVLRGGWKTKINFALSTNISATLSLITKDSDLLWLGYFRNPIEVGYYKLAISLTTLVLIPVSPLTQTVYPEITREVAAHRWVQLRKLLWRCSGLAASYTIPVSLFFGILSPWLIGFFYGPEFVPAAAVLVILLLGLAFANILFWSRPALLALNRSDYPVKVNILVSFLKLIGIFILLPRLGYIGNAILLTGLYLIGVTISVWKVYAELRRQETTVTEVLYS